MGGLTVGSLFSGAGGMDRGFEQAGFRTAWHSEIDRDAASVLRRHWPGVPNLGDVRQIHGGRIEPVDVIEGGSPCQDVSLAGTRAGLDGARSGRFFDYVRIVRQMREATNGRHPAVVVLENVDGLLSSNDGRDFAVVLGRLQECGAAVAYRKLDAQFFGVPQRRRRVFVVADFAPVGVGEERAAQVLALGESLCRHPEAGDEAGQGIAATAENGPGVGGGIFSESGPGWWSDGFGCLRAEGENRPSRPSHVVLEPFGADLTNCLVGDDDLAGTLTTEQAHGNRGQVIVAPWDESQITSTANRARREHVVAVPTLNGSGRVSLVVGETASTVTGEYGQQAYHGDGSDNLIAEAYAPDVAATLSAGSHASHIPGRRREDDANLVALAFNWQAGGSENDTSFRGKSRQYICRAGDYAGAIGVTRQDAVAVAFHLTQDPISSEDGTPALSAGNHGGCSSLGVLTHDGLRWIVRRLTPREGERLMGWPDDFTRWRDDGSEISDSARWRLIGNGVAAPVAAWIARRLYAALVATP